MWDHLCVGTRAGVKGEATIRQQLQWRAKAVWAPLLTQQPHASQPSAVGERELRRVVERQHELGELGRPNACVNVVPGIHAISQPRVHVSQPRRRWNARSAAHLPLIRSARLSLDGKRAGHAEVERGMWWLVELHPQVLPAAVHRNKLAPGERALELLGVGVAEDDVVLRAAAARGSVQSRQRASNGDAHAPWNAQTTHLASRLLPRGWPRR